MTNEFRRQDFVVNEVERIFEVDKERLDNALAGTGLAYFLAAICIFPLTCFKAAYTILRNPVYRDLSREIPIEERAGIGLSMSFIKDASIDTFYEQLDTCETEGCPSRETTQQQEAFVNLRYIFESDLKLRGTILNTRHHKLTDEELLEGAQTGCVKAKYITQKITFGNELNKVLKRAFPYLKHCKIRGGSDTYIVFENDGVFELERKLREVFMEPVTIVLKKKAVVAQ